MSTDLPQNIIRLFGMTTLQIKSSIESIEKSHQIKLSPESSELQFDHIQYSQFDFDIRQRAKRMSFHYEIFYCLENSIRTIIREVLTRRFGQDWWDKAVEEKIRNEVADRMRRDQDSGFALRSGDYLDFANFGELSNIIEKQWDCFDDLFTSKLAMKRVMAALNTLRGPIAHCCDLAEDEVTRLGITINDWFRLMN